MKPHQRILAANGYDFHLVETGSGPPVLFVHGSVSDYRTWSAPLAAFGGRYRAVAYSRRYHWPNEPIAADDDYAMTQQADDLVAIIEALDTGPVHLVGHSYGAFLALLAAGQNLALVRSLVLAEPPVVPLFMSNHPGPMEIAKLLMSRPRTAAVLVKFGATGLEPATKAVRKGYHEKALQIFGKVVLGKEAFHALPKTRLAQVRDNFIAAEFTGSGFAALNDSQIRKIARPVLLLTGARSPRLFHRLADRLEELLPDTQRVEIPDASHIMHEDNPPAFDRAVLQFLESVG